MNTNINKCSAYVGDKKKQENASKILFNTGLSIFYIYGMFYFKNLVTK